MILRGRDGMLKRWFSAWIEQDAGEIDEVFAEGIVYSECYGPEYRGIAQIKRWFEDWNRRGRVIEWIIRESWQEGDTVVAEWYFRCEYDGEMDGFDGVTIARFGDEGKIVHLREFQSKAEHIFPYGEKEI